MRPQRDDPSVLFDLAAEPFENYLRPLSTVVPHPDLCVQAPAHIDEGKVGRGPRDSKASQLLRSEGSRSGDRNKISKLCVYSFIAYNVVAAAVDRWWRVGCRAT